MISEKTPEQLQADAERYRAERDVLRLELKTAEAKVVLAETRLKWIRRAADNVIDDVQPADRERLRVWITALRNAVQCL